MKFRRIVKNQAWFLYILQCSDQSLYTGIAKNVLHRVTEHRSGHGSKYVRSRLPVKLVYSKKFSNQSEALKHEAKIKKLSHLKKLLLLINN